MLIAYTKNANVAEVERSDLPDVRPSRPTSSATSRPSCAQRYADAIRQHPLRREIISTRIVNQMVNLSGISFDHRMTEDTGASVVDVTRAWVVARDVLVVRRAVGRDRRPDRRGPARGPARPVPRLPPDGRACGAVAAAAPPPADRHRRRRRPVPPGHDRAGPSLEPVLVGRMADVVQSVEASRLTAGVPEELAERAGVWPLLHTGFDLVEVAERPRDGSR